MQIRKLTDDIRPWAKKFSQIIVGDPDSAEIDLFLNKVTIDAAVFAISMDHRECERDRHAAVAINVEILNKCLKKYGGSINKWIYCSTQQVYGEFGVTVSEEDICRPKNIYGETHLMAENLGQNIESSAKRFFASLRLSNVYGAPAYFSEKFNKFVVQDLCQQAVVQNKIVLNSDGSPQRDLVHLNDLCSAVNLILNQEHLGADQSVFNLGSGQTVSILEIARTVRQVGHDILKKDIPVYKAIRGKGTDFGHSGDSVQLNLVSSNSMEELTTNFVYPVERLKRIGYVPTGVLYKGVFDTFKYFLDHS